MYRNQIYYYTNYYINAIDLITKFKNNCDTVDNNNNSIHGCVGQVYEFNFIYDTFSNIILNKQ